MYKRMFCYNRPGRASMIDCDIYAKELNIESGAQPVEDINDPFQVAAATDRIAEEMHETGEDAFDSLPINLFQVNNIYAYTYQHTSYTISTVTLTFFIYISSFLATSHTINHKAQRTVSN